MATFIQQVLRASTCALAIGFFADTASAQQNQARRDCAALARAAKTNPQIEQCPDLTINMDDSFIYEKGREYMPSCDKAPAMFQGFIAIKNVGLGRWPPKQGSGLGEIVNRLDNKELTLLKLYNPYNPDLKARDWNETKPEVFNHDELEPLDQKGFKFKFAENQEKRGRNYFSPTSSDNFFAGDDEIYLIQAALNSLKIKGVYVKPDGQDGPGTRKAILAFQKARNYRPTGKLTPPQKEELFRAYGPFGANYHVCVDLFAFVDPDNIVQESNEANNLEAWRIEIDCRDRKSPKTTVISSASKSYKACNANHYTAGARRAKWRKFRHHHHPHDHRR